MKKTSRERTDLFYNSKNKPQKIHSGYIIAAVITIIVLSFLAYRYGYNIAGAALDQNNK